MRAVGWGIIAASEADKRAVRPTEIMRVVSYQSACLI